MAIVDTTTLRRLHEAMRLIHSHGPVPFHERVFSALNMLYRNCEYALELFGKDGSYAVHSNLPFETIKQSDILERTSELVQKQSPMFQRLAGGETSPMRLSDFLTLRELRTTDLYHEIFRPLGLNRQIGIPIQSAACLGGLTINRWGLDFNEGDLAIAEVIAPQIATAFEVDQMIRKLSPAVKEEVRKIDYKKLRRLGLSRRECDVICWMAEGKRDGEIAIILNISVRTVNQHVHSILKKLGVETRTAAVALIMRHDGIPPAADR